VISLELLTIFVFGPLCLLQAYLVFKRSDWRHLLQVDFQLHYHLLEIYQLDQLQVIICVAELYGGWMTFCPEWVDGSPNLNGSDPILLWIYLVFMNGLWVRYQTTFLTHIYRSTSHSSSYGTPLSSSWRQLEGLRRKDWRGPPSLRWLVLLGFILP